MLFKKLDFMEQKIIQDLLDHGTQIKDIAKTLNRSTTTIYNEINKGGGLRLYNAERAQESSDMRTLEGNKGKNGPLQRACKCIEKLENEVEELKRKINENK